MNCKPQLSFLCQRQAPRFSMFLHLVSLLLWTQMFLLSEGYAQNYTLTTAVLVNSQSSTGYNINTSTPGEYQRFTERYLEHLQIPYEVFDVATQTPPNLSSRQLIIAGHRGLNLSSVWQSTIASAVANGGGFVNLDWASNVGQQSHIQDIFGATGSTTGTAATLIRIPEALLQGQANAHFIAGMQRKFLNAPAGDIVYNFHVDGNGALLSAISTVLTGSQGTVIAQLGSDPLIVASNFGQGRAVHFGTLDYLRADRFGFFMGVDDLFWRSLVWAARKPFVVRGYPRWWAVQIDDALPGWPDRLRDMYDTTLTGTVAPNGTGGPWRVTSYLFTDNMAPGSADRVMAIADINAERLHVAPHSRGADYGSLYWEVPGGAQLTDATWLTTVSEIQAWLQGNGGADTIPFISRSMVPHFWNLSNLTGYDLWNTLGIRYITEIQRPGIDFYSKTDADRLRLRPFRRYEIPPAPSRDENYPIYIADDYTVGGRTGLPSQTFFNFTTQIIDLARYDRQDVAWPNTTRSVNVSVDQFQYYTWRLWSGLAPTQIYTHDGSSNYILSTPAQRQSVIQQVSSWLNQNGVRHTFMENLGDYMYARTRSTLTSSQFLASNEVVLNFSGNAATADGALIPTEVLFFNGDNEGTSLSVPGFTGGSAVTLSVLTNPLPTLTSISPTNVTAGGPTFVLTVNGTGFVNGAIVRWNGANRTTTFVSSTQLTALISAADIVSSGSRLVTVFNPAPGGGTSNPQTLTVNNPTPTTTGISPNSALNGSAGFTLTILGSNFTNASVVRWNGADRPSTLVSSNQMTATIAAADIATAGTAQVTVFTAAPGGGTSNAQTFTITAGSNPVPVMTLLNPNTRTAGSGGFTLTVSGSNFVVSSVVRWNGASRATTFVSPTQLDAVIPAADVATEGTVQVTVENPAPGGGVSGTLTLTILGTGTFLDDFNRADGANIGNGWVEKTAAAFSLATNRITKAVTGSTFVDNLVHRPTTEAILNGEASIEFRLTSASPGYPQVFVRGQTANIATAGTFSGYLLFVDNAVNRAFLNRIENGNFFQLAQINLNPTLNTTDTYRLRIRATGTNPIAVQGVVERLSGTTWNAIGQASVNDNAATRFTTAGTVGFSGHTEGNTYVYDNFMRIDLAGGGGSNPLPTVNALDPAAAPAGGAAFILTVTGTNFVNGATIQWNGANRPTTFVSSTQLSATIPAGDIATVSSATVTVLNPTPGGGTSNAQFFAVLNPNGTFSDNFNRANNVTIGNGWTEKFPEAFSLQNNEVVSIDTNPIDYHDTIVYRPVGEDHLDTEVGLEFRLLSGLNFPQVHARIQRDTLLQTNTLESYIFFVDGFEPSPGRAIIARQPAVPGQFECYMLAIPFPTPLQQDSVTRYRLRFRVTGANPVTLTGFVDRFDGTTWQPFVSGTTVHANSTQDPGLYCDPGFMPPPLSTPGAVGFAKWTTNNEILDNFSWTNLAVAGNPVPTTTSLSPSTATAGGASFTLTVNGTNFIAGSVVRWNGVARSTTFVSATQLTAAIPAADIASAGIAQVTVFNPTPGGGTSNSQSFTINEVVFSDNFDRAGNANLGNGWVEKTPATFSIATNRVTKTAGPSFANNLVYRPAAENLLNVEASLEVRFASVPPAYPQVFVRGQTDTIANAGVITGYLLFLDNATNRALLSRMENGNFAQTFPQITLDPAVNTTDTYRLRLRATGTNPVVVSAFVERFNGATWEVIGQTTVNDTATTRVQTSGTVGFSGHTEGSTYTYDNFTRTALP